MASLINGDLQEKKQEALRMYESGFPVKTLMTSMGYAGDCVFYDWLKNDENFRDSFKKIKRPRGDNAVRGKLIKDGRFIPEQKDLPKKEEKPTEKSQAKKESFVYFVKCESFVKIGISSNLKERINKIKTNTPFEVEVIALFSGSELLESTLHALFSQFKQKNEWFFFSDEIKKYLEQHSRHDLKGIEF